MYGYCTGNSQAASGLPNTASLACRGSGGCLTTGSYWARSFTSLDHRRLPSRPSQPMYVMRVAYIPRLWYRHSKHCLCRVPAPLSHMSDLRSRVTTGTRSSPVSTEFGFTAGMAYGYRYVAGRSLTRWYAGHSGRKAQTATTPCMQAGPLGSLGPKTFLSSWIWIMPL